MAKIPFTPTRDNRYNGVLSEIKFRLQRWANMLRREPKSKPFIEVAVREFQTAAGLSAVPATSAIVANNASVPLGDATAVANGQDNGTAAVTASAITRITLPGTDKIIKSTVKYSGPAITGSYVNGYTFTIAAGVITGIVAS